MNVNYSGVSNKFYPVSKKEREIILKKNDWPEKYLLAVGSLQPRKNLDRLLKAWKIVSPKFKDVQLMIIGEGDKIFSSTGINEIPERVKMLGYINDTNLVALYSGAIGFVFPSLYEGFGLPILEAMACGTPVITSNLTSMPEIAGDAALLIDPYNINCLAEAMEMILSSESLRNDLKEKGFKRVKEFSYELNAKFLISRIT